MTNIIVLLVHSLLRDYVITYLCTDKTLTKHYFNCLFSRRLHTYAYYFSSFALWYFLWCIKMIYLAPHIPHHKVYVFRLSSCPFDTFTIETYRRYLRKWKDKYVLEPNALDTFFSVQKKLTVFKYESNLRRYKAVVFPAESSPTITTWWGLCKNRHKN